ncbi:MAG: hypothetical protein ACD_21C00016G0005 [uncultured bacterium]|nr:MAG: hypothetical protein ACD_21C00016G0005 [uncultured bacterium]
MMSDKTNAKEVEEVGTRFNGSSVDESSEEAVARLAKLALIEYAQVRKQEAEKLNIPVGFLDAAIKNYQQLALVDLDKKSELETGVDPWEYEVNGNIIADEIRDLVEKHVILSKHQITVLVLWVFGTYCIDAFGIFPKLLITSPDKRCGKTTALSVLNSVANRALATSNATPSAIFRSIELWKPTLLIDEGDTFINNDDGNLKGVINSGHTKDTAYVLRVEGDNNNRHPKQFSTWTPMVIAMIKNPPDTIIDRSVVIKLRRKLTSERTAKWPFDNFSKLESLRRQLKRWSDDSFETLKNHAPNMPIIDNDRTADNWVPLFAIASLLGAAWLANVEEAFRDLNGSHEKSDENINTLLLMDIKEIFIETNFDKIHSSDLVIRLVELEDHPWSEYRHGKPITCNTLAKLLSSFGIKPRQIRIGQNKQGYYLSDFEDTFSRYIPSIQNPTTLHSASGLVFNDFVNPTDNMSVGF